MLIDIQISVSDNSFELYRASVAEKEMSLLKAARENSLSRCEQLLAAGSDVGERNKKGWTPLLSAAHHGNTEVCRLLLERGKANIEERTPCGNTALNLAARKGHARTVSLLVSKGARLDTKDRKGYTPFLAAVEKGHIEVCKVLLETGEVNVKETRDGLIHDFYICSLHGR